MKNSEKNSDVKNISNKADKLKKHNGFRHSIQAAFALLTNSHFAGFITGKLYKGPLKNFCVPGMNCYSCPGAIGACPIGAMQAVLGSKKKFSFYILGFLAFIGILVGRFVCAWLCLFGLIQELLYMIPTPKLTVPKKIDKLLRYLKYVILVLFVVVLPLTAKVEGVVSVPYFCKFICPVGMLEGGIPLVLLNKALRSSLGFLYAWKGIILALVIIASIFIYRPFCKYICPLGAFYSLFQKISFLKLKVNKDKCVSCNACSTQCKMNVNVLKNPNSPECIRCGECVKRCPTQALKFTFKKSES